jgi:hypothetical protein
MTATATHAITIQITMQTNTAIAGEHSGDRCQTRQNKSGGYSTHETKSRTNDEADKPRGPTATYASTKNRMSTKSCVASDSKFGRALLAGAVVLGETGTADTCRTQTTTMTISDQIGDRKETRFFFFFFFFFYDIRSLATRRLVLCDELRQR